MTGAASMKGTMTMDSMTIRERPPEAGPFRPRTGTEETPDGFTAEQDSNIRIVTNSLHRLNEAVTEAVKAGLTVEIKRASRFHGGTGNWGDQIYLVLHNDG